MKLTSDLRVIAALALGGVLVASFLLASGAERINQRTAVASLAVYASLRAVNSALSTAQETEVQIGVGVAGGGVKPLKILEPVDDTIERVAGVVFWIAIATGLLSVGLWPLVYLGMALLFAAFLARLLIPGHREESILVRQVSSMGILLALIVPMVFVIAPTVAEIATRSHWNSAIDVLSTVSERANEFVESQSSDSLGDDVVEMDDGFVAWLRDAFSSTGDVIVEGFSVTRDIANAGLFYLGEADELARALVVIVSVSILKTLVMPAIALLICLSFLKRGLDQRILPWSFNKQTS